MADVFVSYTHPNRACAQMLSDALAIQGWSIWWDREIPIGQNFHQVIEQALAAARSVSVIWSRHSVFSNWVLEEAAEGRSRNILFPVKIDNVPIPLGFRSIQTADLTGWNGTSEHAGFKTLLKSLGTHLGGPREIPIDEAMRLIQRFCEQRKVIISTISPIGTSSTGAKFIAAAAKDGMGYVYCHITGSRLGEVYYVRKGISLYYHNHIGGPSSTLGLPISNEELVDNTGFPTSFFENGYIDWSPVTWYARAVLILGEHEEPLGEPIQI
jgi:hypothetical protein